MKTRKNNIKTHKNSQYKHKNQWEILRQYDSYLNEPSKVELFVSFGVQFKLKYCRISPYFTIEVLGHYEFYTLKYTTKCDSHSSRDSRKSNDQKCV